MKEDAAATAAGRHPLDEADGCRVVIRNGTFDRALSDVSGVPDGVFVGSLANAPADVAAQMVSGNCCYKAAHIPGILALQKMPVCIEWSG
jgi:hypothetical protein